MMSDGVFRALEEQCQAPAEQEQQQFINKIAKKWSPFNLLRSSICTSHPIENVFYAFIFPINVALVTLWDMITLQEKQTEFSCLEPPFK